MQEVRSQERVNLWSQLNDLRKQITKDNIKSWTKSLYTDAKTSLEDVGTRLQNLKKSNYDLALYHYSRGNLFDTRFRFWFYNRFWKDAPESNYFIGRSYLEEGNFKKATGYLENYIASNDNKFRAEALYSLKIINNDLGDIKAIPEMITSKNQERFIQKYKAMTEEVVQFASLYLEFATQIKNAASNTDKPLGNKVLDLGCGFGQVAQVLLAEKVAINLTLVDGFEGNIKEAQALKVDDKEVYSRTLVKDPLDLIAEEVHQGGIQYDFIFASNLFDYCTDVKEALAAIPLLVKAGGFAAVMMQKSPSESATLSTICPTREIFTYSYPEIKNLVEGLGLIISSEYDFPPENGNNAFILILKKN